MQNNLYVVGGLSRVGKGKVAARMKERDASLEAFSTDQFRPSGDNEQAWLNIIDFIERRQFTSDVIIEGIAISPQKVHGLELNNLKVKRVAFIGYSNESHADFVLAHAAQAKNADWVYSGMQAGRISEQEVRGWTKSGIPESAKLRTEAETYGYAYFDVTACPFD